MNTANLLLIGAGLWLASRFLKRPGDPGESGVVSKGGIGLVSSGQGLAGMGASTKAVGKTAYITVGGITWSTTKDGVAVPWDYKVGITALKGGVGVWSDASNEGGAAASAGAARNFSFVATADMVGSLDLKVQLLAAVPNPDGTPSASFTAIAVKDIPGAFTVSSAVTSAGTIGTVTTAQYREGRAMLSMYAGR